MCMTMLNKEDKKIERFNPSIKDGLSSTQVEDRKEAKLVNKSKKAFGKSYTEIIVTNVFSFFNVLLYLIAAVLIYTTIRTHEIKILWGLFFLVVLVANTGIGLYEDISARKLLSKLRLITQAKAIVIRNGQREEIPTEEVVLDDILYIEKDSQICVDGILLSGEVSVNESLITGESVNVYKKINEEVYSGTYVTSGSAYIRADKVGVDCLANSLQSKANKFKRSPSEILRSLNRMFVVIGATVITMGIFMLVTFILQGKFSTEESIVTSVRSITGSMVAMIPSGLYLLTSTALAVGVINLAQKKAQIQDFYSVEMLARVDTLCVDKTGTITDGNLVVKKTVIFDAKTKKEYVAQAIANVLNATNDNNSTALALRKEFDYQLSTTVKVALPFSSENKYSGATFTGGKTFIIGAPEFLAIKNKDAILKKCEEYTKQGLRVIVLAEGNKEIKDNKYTGELVALAMVIIKDHVRDDALETFKWFAENNVDIKVISGDNAQTVSAVAVEAGIKNAINFISLEGMNLEEVKEVATKYTVFGRVTPEQKEALVMALKKASKTVAMTGDGVNDILALKRSDCSIAMASGAEAARNVSHIVLLDSNFARLPAVVDEGRRVVNNLQRTASLFVTKTIFAFALTLVFTLASIIFRDPSIQYPFVTNHLYLWELVTSGFAAFFLALEKNNERIEGSFLLNVFKKAVPAACMLLAAVFTMFILYLFQKNGIVSWGIYSKNTAIAMSIIAFSVLGTVFLYKVCSPLSKYRRIVLTVSATVNILALVASAIVTYATNRSEDILQIPYLEMSGPTYLITGIVIIVLASIYLLTYQAIAAYKGKDNKNEN